MGKHNVRSSTGRGYERPPIQTFANRMLHEILLSLSGQPSPLLDTQTEKGDPARSSFPLLSPPEKALLDSLARLSRLHALLRAHTSKISAAHPSTICRAVSTAIATEHLGRFQKKIVEVEKSILLNDSSYVGGYGIVPLSTLVGEFAPWTRRMEWLWEVARFMKPDSTQDRGPGNCSGAAVIDYLRQESQTGYIDLEEMAVQLVKAAETAWMRQLSMWLLYGNLPAFGKEDFFIQEDTSNEGDGLDFVMHADLLPKFVSSTTASSILFIGKSLNHIRAKRKTSTADASQSSLSQVTLQGDHIGHLSSLASPISRTNFSNAITAIRLSLSQTALSKLLPLPKILEVLSLLHDFLLLGRGEFAMALVSQADKRIYGRHRSRTAGSLDGLAIKEGEAMAVLTQTWAELASLQNEEDPVDDELELARDLLRLSVSGKKSSRAATPQDGSGPSLIAEISSVSFDDLLFPTPTSLSLQVRPPLDLFLAASDIAIYSRIHSYLLGIRRAQIRLGDLWKHTSLRRSYPSPWGPPRSNKRGGEYQLRIRRQRENTRTVQMRRIWATSSASLFVLSEIGSYFQGEVINGSWQHLRESIEGTSSSPLSRPASRPGTSSKASSRPGTGHSMKQLHRTASSETTATDNPFNQSAQLRHQPHDPEALTVAHRRYIASLVQSLFLTDVPFTSALRSLLTNIDHLIALVSRLEAVQRNLDLETDEGVVDALADYAREETSIRHELRETCNEIETGIKDVIARLRDIDDSRSGEGRRLFDLGNPNRTAAVPVAAPAPAQPMDMYDYIPRKAAGVDRLLMKLDFGSLNSSLDQGYYYPLPGTEGAQQ
ncbi:hypothetical protein DTO271D3_8067 [Paecilomyces variotii]|nr:hypothetical protein DTO169C6_8862 [Paecilomyces variotii]KAJ9311693.1 hypothetical protein DTO271D3_8067 [Paecilomyces variotii]